MGAEIHQIPASHLTNQARTNGRKRFQLTLLGAVLRMRLISLRKSSKKGFRYILHLLLGSLSLDFKTLFKGHAHL